MSEDKASTPHPRYAELEQKREVFRAVMGGTDGIRAKREQFLPKYPAEQDSEYNARLAASTIDGIVAGGVDSLCGSVFDGEINTSKVTESLKPYLENVDNKGNSFNYFAREAFKASFEGCSLILVDTPTAKASDLGEQKALGLRPYMSLYHAGNIINWRYEVNPVSKILELVLLVLKEESQEPKGNFLFEKVTKYRVFRKNGSVITWELYREVKDEGSKETKLILEGSGTYNKLTEIPARFIGDVCDDPKLLAESRLEIKAYQKESSFDVIEYLSIPTLCVKGRDNKDQNLALGASTVIDIPVDGDAFYLQIDAKGHESLKGSVHEIKQTIRARVNYLIDEAKSAQKTATEVTINDRDKQARLIVWADELLDALEGALQFMGQFSGLGKDAAGSLQLSTSWDRAKVAMDAADVTAEANLVVDGLQSRKTFIEKRHAAGQLPEDVDVEEELKRIAEDERVTAPLRDAMNMPNDQGAMNNATPNQTAPQPQTQRAA